MKFVSNDRLICSYNDGSISMSLIKEKIQTLNNIKGSRFKEEFHSHEDYLIVDFLFQVFNEPLPYLIVNSNQLITATSSNKIGMHSNIDKLGQVNIKIAHC